MYGILVLCFGKRNKIACYPGATMAECIVLCLGYLSYVWDISLMYGIFVLGFGKIKITCHSGATMAERIVLCLGYLSYVWNISLTSGILVLCL